MYIHGATLILNTSVTPSHNATKQVGICSQVHLTDVSSRELSCKHRQTDRQAQASKACLAPGDPSRGRLGHQGVAQCDEASGHAAKFICSRCDKCLVKRIVMQVDQNRQISSGVEGLLCAGHLAGPSRGRLGRQEACPEAVLGARRPVLSARRGTQGRERQEDRPEAVFGARSARRPVWRPSWAPGGPSTAVQRPSGRQARFERQA